jgi:N-acetylmuramoyl-L-alanine amidase
MMRASDTAPTAMNPHHRRMVGIRRVTLRSPRFSWVIALVVGGCARDEFAIPVADGPLALEVRYPTSVPMTIMDSISVWGSVGSGAAKLSVNGHRVRVAPNGGFAAFIPVPPGQPPVLEFEARKGAAVLRRSIPLVRSRQTVDSPARLRPVARWVRLRRPPSDTTDPARQASPIYSRWTPGGILALPLPQGIRLPADAETAEALRVRLTKGVAVWVPRAEVEDAPPRRSVPVVTDLRISESEAQSVLDVAVAEPLLTTVELVRSHLRWTLVGARSWASRPVPESRGLVRGVTVKESKDGAVIVDVALGAALLGWRTTWGRGRARLELRPGPDSVNGLTGLVVALDPGHPPLGTLGPTGLAEDSLTLAIAIEAARRLRAIGARPFLTREDARPVSLEARVALAEEAGAQLFVSIHANAPGDGRPPWSVDGTRVYWLQPQARRLARSLEVSVAAALHAVASGSIHSDFAVTRATWFPAVLIEGTGLTMPAREAYLRSPGGIAAYAAGIVAGVQEWVRGGPDPSGGARERVR